MKPLVFFASLLLLARAVFAEQIVVFGKEKTLVLDADKPAAAPQAPADAAFLETVKADLVHHVAFAAPLDLSAPPSWGKTVPRAAGNIEFHDTFRGGFFVRVNLLRLAPRHRYILTLNGNPELAGNDRLVDVVPGMATERYFDFLTITTDAHGNYAATFAIALAAGPYDVRFYVKDTTDFKIVLYHDYFKFTVE